MRFSTLLSILSYSCCAATVSASSQFAPPRWPQDVRSDPSSSYTTNHHLFSNPPTPFAADAPKHRIPTSRESAVMGRRILALTPIGTLTTVYPPDQDRLSADSEGAEALAENHPAGLGGVPVGLMEYIADCEDDGNPTLLAVDIATPFRNMRAGSNVSLAVRWAPPHPPARRLSAALGGEMRAWDGFVGAAARLFGLNRNKNTDTGRNSDGSPRYTLPYSAANLPRFVLVGRVEDIFPDGGWDGDSRAGVAGCFLAAHPDARLWLPGHSFHHTRFARLVVEHVYWMGGFGDRAYIGWIPLEEWNAVSRREWEDIKLPGEESGWDERKTGREEGTGDEEQYDL